MSDLLSIGKSGLFTSKKALEVTGHNISNANTEGFSRQKLDQTANAPIGKDGLVMGTGSKVRNINRVHDRFLEKRLNSNLSSHNFSDERASQLEQVEAIFNEANSEGLNHILNKFYNSFRDLANQPENETIRSVVRDTATIVIKDLRRIRSSLDELARTIDKKLEVDVDDINHKLKAIAKLNRRIMELEATGAETGDLRDQRDTEVRGLSKYFTVTTYLNDKNQFVVNAKGVGTLVEAATTQELRVGSTNKEGSSNNMAGSNEVYFKDRATLPVTDRFSGGVFSSSITVRNQDIRQLQENVDNIAYELINTVNAVHRRGYVNRKIPMSPEGIPANPDRIGPTTGINFFKTPASKENAALYIDLSDEVKEDLSNIATALKPNSPGDNRIALGISKLQHEKILHGGTTTLEEEYLQVIGRIGIESGKAQLDKEQAQGILSQTQAMKERISGVSIDEEAANMVKYQHAYEASAKVLKAADEMFKTVLAIKS